MLMLSRKRDESIVIQVGDEIINISITDINSGKKQVQLGIDAPKNIKVWRSEIYDSILENKKASFASKINPSSLRNMIK